MSERQTREAKIEEMRHERQMLKNRVTTLTEQVDRENPDKELVATILRLYSRIDEYSNGILLLQD